MVDLAVAVAVAAAAAVVVVVVVVVVGVFFRGGLRLFRVFYGDSRNAVGAGSTGKNRDFRCPSRARTQVGREGGHSLIWPSFFDNMLHLARKFCLSSSCVPL